MPISAPKPNSPPSQNWVEAFHIATALSMPARKRSRRRRVLGDDGVGVLAAVRGDMREAASTPSTTAIDSTASSHSVSKSAALAAGRSGTMARAARIGAEVAAERTQIGDQHRQQRGRDRGVDQQRLGGAADAGAAHLRVGQRSRRAMSGSAAAWT